MSIDIERLQLIKAKPVLFMEDLADLLDLSVHSLRPIIKATPPAGMFRLGKRVAIKAEDANEWIEQLSSSRAYTPRKNNYPKTRASHAK